MSSPIFDATFGTGRFKSEEPMTTSDQSQATPASPAPSSEPQDVRGLAREAADTISRELAELGVRVPDDLREPIASEIRKVIRAALAQSDARPAGDAGLIEAAEWLSKAASRFEEAADALRSEYKTYARQMDRWAGDTRERARLFRIFSRAADRSVHGDLIPDCPTDGVAARQGNGG